MIVQICKTLVYLKKPPNPNFLQLQYSAGCCFSLFFSTQSSIYPEKSSTFLVYPEKSSTFLVDFFIQKHQFSPKTATKAANALSHIKKPENLDSVLAFLKENAFSKTHLEALLSNTGGPKVLCSSVDRTLKPKIMIFRSFGFSAYDMVSMLSANPWLLGHSGYNRILPSILVLKDILGSVYCVVKLLKVSVWFLKYDLEKTLLPNIEFLKSCGIGMDQLIRHIFLSPRTFLRSIEKLKKDVQKVDELKFDKNSKTYLYAVTTVSRLSDETWDEKLEFLASLGFSEDEVLQMFRKNPQFIAVSKSKIEEVVKVLFSSGKYEI
ncbi:hypothetical protein Leryth_020662 [Lithospermum erythrorhizon]|nr:hypothetical protein Leryth_020662 [Lithospermum erythrorhizon]